MCVSMELIKFHRLSETQFVNNEMRALSTPDSIDNILFLVGEFL